VVICLAKIVLANDRTWVLLIDSTVCLITSLSKDERRMSSDLHHVENCKIINYEIKLDTILIMNRINHMLN